MEIPLYLLRHGNTFESGETPVQVGAQTDIALTSRGREQARSFAALLKQRKVVPSHIYSGGLMRQKETAEIIASELSCEGRCSHGHQALDEIDYGAWEGLSVEAIQELAPDAYRDWSEAAIWPETIFRGSLSQHLAAMKSFLDYLLQTYSSRDTVVVVSSNGVLRLFRTFEPEQWSRILTRRAVEECKVKTGNYCMASLKAGPEIRVNSWNVSPTR